MGAYGSREEKLRSVKRQRNAADQNAVKIAKLAVQVREPLPLEKRFRGEIMRNQARRANCASRREENRHETLPEDAAALRQLEAASVAAAVARATAEAAVL